MSRLFVEVRTGPARGERRTIDPGQSLAIGRTERASLILPGDPKVSALHCEIAWDGKACTLRDLGSIAGTKIDGIPFESGPIGDGTTVQAGDTVVSVYFEDGIPPRKRHVPTEAERSLRLAALAELRAAGPLYAVLDAARDDRVLELLCRADEERISLYEGLQGRTLDHVAPYLVGFQERSRLLPRLVMEGWGSAWGIYLTFRGKRRDLRAHLRRFLQVLDEETGKTLYFRYYDPRVLRGFFPACTPVQIADMLGEIDAIRLEGEASEVLRFTKDQALAAEAVAP